MTILVILINSKSEILAYYILIDSGDSCIFQVHLLSQRIIKEIKAKSATLDEFLLCNYMCIMPLVNV